MCGMGDFTGKWYSIEGRGEVLYVIGMSWADLATMTYYYVEHLVKELFNGGCNECVHVCVCANNSWMG